MMAVSACHFANYQNYSFSYIASCIGHKPGDIPFHCDALWTDHLIQGWRATTIFAIQRLAVQLLPVFLYLNISGFCCQTLTAPVWWCTIDIVENRPFVLWYSFGMQWNRILAVWSRRHVSGHEIVTIDSQMWLEIKLWWPKFLNWLPAGDQPFVSRRFHTFKEKCWRKTCFCEVAQEDQEDSIHQVCCVYCAMCRHRSYFMLYSSWICCGSYGKSHYHICLYSVYMSICISKFGDQTLWTDDFCCFGVVTSWHLDKQVNFRSWVFPWHVLSFIFPWWTLVIAQLPSKPSHFFRKRWLAGLFGWKPECDHMWRGYLWIHVRSKLPFRCILMFLFPTLVPHYLCGVKLFLGKFI